MDVDDVLVQIGECGRYQKLLLWFVLLPAVLPCAFHAYAQVFISAKPAHWCGGPQLESVSLSEETVRNLSIVRDGDDYKECYRFDRNYSHEIIEEIQSVPSMTPCKDGWKYDSSKYKSTVVTEWDLVCEKGFSTTLALVLYAVGGLIGNYIFGYVQDMMGRRPAFFIYLGIESLFTVASAFATDFMTWMILRIGVGFTVPAILGTPMVLSLELVGPEKRTMAFVLVNIAFSLGLVLLSGVVWWIRSWRQLTLATCLPFLIFFSYWWVMPESPRWLLSRGKYMEAEKILRTMAMVNGKQLPDNCMYRLRKKMEMNNKETQDESARTYGIFDLFRHKNLRRNTIIVTFIWFTNTAVYVGLSYYAPALGGDEFLNFFLAAVVELPTYFVLWPALEHVGRRWVLATSMAIGGTACLATVFAHKSHSLMLGLYCIGKMGISCSFVAVPLVASELYPTVVRGLGMSTSSVVAQIGPILAPLLNYLLIQAVTVSFGFQVFSSIHKASWNGETWRIVPLAVMGLLLILGGASSLLLPETLHQHLPQTLQDGETFGLRQKRVKIDEPDIDDS